MECDLLTGRSRACKSNMAGVKAIYLANYGTLGEVTMNVTDTDVIETLGDAPEFFKYELKGNTNTYVETPNVSSDNGTAFMSQVLSITLPKLTRSMHKEFKLILWGSPHIIVEDMNGEFYLMGKENGADVTGGSLQTGGAKGDLAGYTLVLTAEERIPANFLFNANPPLLGVIEDTTATVSAVMEQP